MLLTPPHAPPACSSDGCLPGSSGFTVAQPDPVEVGGGKTRVQRLGVVPPPQSSLSLLGAHLLSKEQVFLGQQGLQEGVCAVQRSSIVRIGKPRCSRFQHKPSVF